MRSRYPGIQLVRSAVIASLAAVISGAGCASTRPSGQATADASTARATAGEKWFATTADGRRVAVFERRLEGRTRIHPQVVVFLPTGSYSSRSKWDLGYDDYSVMGWLARRGWRCFAVDTLGHGESDDPPASSTGEATDAVDVLAVAIDAIRQRTGADRVHVVGASWGAQVAGLFAQRHPGRIAGLVLHGFTWRHRIALESVERAMGKGFLDRARTIPMDVERARRGFVPQCVDPAVADAFAGVVTEHRSASPIGSLKDYVHNLPIVDPTQVAVPTLVIYGEYEYGVPAEDPEGQAHRDGRWQENLAFFGALETTRKEFAVLPAGGHSIYLERGRELWLARVQSFLSSCPAGR